MSTFVLLGSASNDPNVRGAALPAETPLFFCSGVRCYTVSLAALPRPRAVPWCRVVEGFTRVRKASACPGLSWRRRRTMYRIHKVAAACCFVGCY